MRQLSRLCITENIHEYTPMCVLIEIADSHGIKYEQKDIEKPNFSKFLIETINQTNIPTIGEIKERTEWEYVARFVNRNCQWPQNKLVEAYNFLSSFMTKEDPLNKIPNDFVYGLQTPINPKSINACVLYKTCVYHRLNITTRTTINQMAYAVRMLREDIESVLRRTQIYVERDAKRLDLINILMLSPYEIQDPDPPLCIDDINPVVIPNTTATHDMLDRLYITLNNTRELQSKIDPTTYCGSVALAAINYGLDISKSSNPIREYKILKRTGKNNYIPSDPWMRYWFQYNPIIFDLSITFNPIFPINYYDHNRLLEMVQMEGYVSNDISSSSPYELMQLAYVTETFYIGKLPNMKSEETSIDLDNINDIPYGELLCYGQLDSPLQPVSINELISLFNINQNFTNPFNNSVFSSTSINKLKLLLQSHVGPISSTTFTPETIIARNNLLEVINSVENITKLTDEPTRQLAFTYRNSSPDTKVVILSTLTKLLHIGMYMRGWLGPGSEYPVIKAPVPPGRQMEIDLHVTSSIAEYEKLCRSLGKIGVQINSLPLVNYRDGHYQASTRSSDGFSIGERLQIVKEGDTTDNISSCIRLSSNWICSSAHKYLIGIGQSPPFDIFNLRYIS